MQLYLVSTQRPDVRFRILSYDPATQKGRLVGSVGIEFEESLAKDYLLAKGYTIVREETECQD